MRTLFLKIVSILCFMINLSYGQSDSDKTIRVLDFGEKVPDYPLVNLVNYPEETAGISAFKGKVLILDYWFTSCKPCIASWPKLLELQKQFEDKIQIVLVNHMEDKTTVQNFMENWRKKSGIDFTLPSANGDSIIHKAIPPQEYPSIAWIDSDGKFKAMTGGDGLNEKNIEHFLNGDIHGMDGKRVVQKFHDPWKPIDSGEILWYSAISDYSPEIGGMMLFIADSEGGYVITLSNRPLLEHIRYAYALREPRPRAKVANYPRLPESRYILAVEDSTRYLPNEGGRYTYQLIAKEPKTIQQLKKKFQEDIQMYFDLDIQWEKQQRKCLVLKAEDTTFLISNNKGGEEAIFVNNHNTSGKSYKMENFTPTRFLAYLEESKPYFFSPYPLIDETGFNGMLDIEYPIYFFDDYKRHAEFDSYLYKKYKMRFVLEEREVDILVIRDKK